MRRALASLLLVLFSFPLILPVLRADEASNLPSCCRREGKHHCTMGHASTSQEGVSPIQAKCSNYSSSFAVHGKWNAAFLGISHTIVATILTYPSLEAQTEAQYRVSFSRSRQKRGPPSLLG